MASAVGAAVGDAVGRAAVALVALVAWPSQFRSFSATVSFMPYILSSTPIVPSHPTPTIAPSSAVAPMASESAAISRL